MTIKDLEPRLLWTYFDQITQVPRPSKKEEKIIQFMLDFGKSLNLETRKDDAGNVLISKPATPGKEHLAKVILQSHVDMVCEKNKDVVHDFDTDPIQTYVADGWLRAKGTTLGADDGIGMAAAMAVLASTDIEHGPIEAVFTVDEETGLTGAFALQKNFLTGDILINLDTEEEGELYIGCAGGMGSKATFTYTPQTAPNNTYWFEIHVKGLLGGHSGSEIHTGLGNANKILNRFLWQLQRICGVVLSEIGGGNLHNAIPREAYAVVGVPADAQRQAEGLLQIFTNEVRNELRGVDDGIKIEMTATNAPAEVFDAQTTNNLLNAIYACPHGVLGMSRDIAGLVETSTNLAAVKMADGNKIVITTSQRSSTESLKRDAANRINAVFTLAGAEVEHTEGYPGWKPNTDSPILAVAKRSYQNLFGVEPEVKAIHAGLECGLFLEKYPHLDMVSCGPTITGAHSPDEQVNIHSVEKWWKFLVDVLQNIPSKQK